VGLAYVYLDRATCSMPSVWLTWRYSTVVSFAVVRCSCDREFCSVQLRAWMYCTARQEQGRRQAWKRPAAVGTATACAWRCTGRARTHNGSRGMEASRLDVSSTGPSPAPLFRVIAISTCAPICGGGSTLGMEAIRADRSSAVVKAGNTVRRSLISS
jgi:hypothetical protein